MTTSSAQLKRNDIPCNPQIDVDKFRADLLAWYKGNARQMPWRAEFGKFPDPYHEWLSEIMLQQTVVKAVIPYFLRFIKLWPTVRDLAQASEEDVMREWAGLGYYARARNLHKCAKIISTDYQGHFPRGEAELLKLPGVGPYTAAAISAIAFGHPSAVMDGNVERVLARLTANKKPLKDAKAELYSYLTSLTNNSTDFPAEFAQAMMELGSEVCAPQKPACPLCPVSYFCAAKKQNIQNSIPTKIQKENKPIKHGVVFFIKNEDGDLLFERRPKKGLLGGMIGLPGTEWKSENDFESYNFFPDLQIKHTFTHFHLILRGARVIQHDYNINNEIYFWSKAEEYDKIGLPTLYKKLLHQYFNHKKS